MAPGGAEKPVTPEVPGGTPEAAKLMTPELMQKRIDAAVAREQTVTKKYQQYYGLSQPWKDAYNKYVKDINALYARIQGAFQKEKNNGGTVLSETQVQLDALRTELASLEKHFGITPPPEPVEPARAPAPAPSPAPAVSLGEASEPAKAPAAKPKPKPNPAPAANPEKAPGAPEVKTKTDLIPLIEKLSPELTRLSRLDERVVGDYADISRGLAVFRSAAKKLDPDSQKALSKSSLIVLPKGIQSTYDGVNLNMDVTLPEAEQVKILKKELESGVFGLNVEKRLPSNVFSVVRPTLGPSLAAFKAEEVGVKLGNVMKSLPAGVVNQLKDKVLYLTCGDSAHSYSTYVDLNIRESEQHIRDFLLRVTAGADAAANPGAIEKGVEERTAYDEALKGLAKDGLILGIDNNPAITSGFKAMTKGIADFRTAVGQLPADERAALSKILLHPVLPGAKTSFGVSVSVDLTLDVEKQKGALAECLKVPVFAGKVGKALTPADFLNIRCDAGFPADTLKAENVAATLNGAIASLPAEMQKALKDKKVYLGTGDKVNTKGAGNWLEINAESGKEVLAAFFREALDETPQDNKYFENREGKAKDVLNPANVKEWIQRQKKFAERMEKAGTPKLSQNFPLPVERALNAAVGKKIGAFTVGKVEKGSGSPVEIDVDTALLQAQKPPVAIEGKKWGLFSDFHKEKGQANSEDVYLFPLGEQEHGILLPAAALFKVDGTVDPDRMARYMVLAEGYRVSEKNDPAKIKTFEIAEKNEKLGCISLVDAVDKTTKKEVASADAFPSLLGKRYNVASSRRVDIDEYVDPLAALKKNVADAKGEGCTSVYLNIVAHGDNEGFVFPGGKKLRAVDILEIFKDNPETKFTLNANGCRGGGLEEAMENFQDSTDPAGRITVFLAGKKHADNLAHQIDESDKEYNTVYEAALATLLDDPANDKVPFGELNQKADALARRITLRNPGVWRSGGLNGKSTQTAQRMEREPGGNAAA